MSVFVLQSMVQVETLGELGVFFTLFVVGLEFSPERLRKVNIILSILIKVCFASSAQLYIISMSCSMGTHIEMTSGLT